MKKHQIIPTANKYRSLLSRIIALSSKLSNNLPAHGTGCNGEDNEANSRNAHKALSPLQFSIMKVISCTFFNTVFRPKNRIHYSGQPSIVTFLYIGSSAFGASRIKFANGILLRKS